MAYSIPLELSVAYEPEELETFEVYGFEYIDNLHFLRDPKDVLGDRAHEYVSIAKRRFLEAGWAGDGEVQLLWLPSFVFPAALDIHWAGEVLWHVKQKSDGISFLMSSMKLPFEEFQS
jgi:hypothetical protein